MTQPAAEPSSPAVAALPALWFSRLALQDFRCYTTLELGLAPRLNAIVGPNGIGKTSLLEAIHYLCLARGFGAERDAMRQSAEYFQISGTLETAPDLSWPPDLPQPVNFAARPRADVPYQDLACNYMPGQGKRVLWNQAPVPRLADHIGRVPVVSILPDDTRLIHDGGSARRRWLDSLIAQYDPEYLRALMRYNQALQQRNALLAQSASTGRADIEMLKLWEAQLSPAGQVLVAARRAFIQRFAQVFAIQYRALVLDEPVEPLTESEAYQPDQGPAADVKAAIAPVPTEVPTLGYYTPVADNTPSGWQALWAQARADDQRRGFSTQGAHRDDLRLRLNQRALRGYGSQGQQKSFVVALKLAQYHFLWQQTQRPPILLLDDVFDKLDPQRVRRLVQFLHAQCPSQVLLTDTDGQRIQTALGALPDFRMIQLPLG
jgi:DNA replication and repair protein RecF